MLDNDYYGTYYELEARVLEVNKRFASNAIKYVKHALMGENLLGCDIRDAIKQCQNCKQIWLF